MFRTLLKNYYLKSHLTRKWDLCHESRGWGGRHQGRQWNVCCTAQNVTVRLVSLYIDCFLKDKVPDSILPVPTVAYTLATEEFSLQLCLCGLQEPWSTGSCAAGVTGGGCEQPVSGPQKQHTQPLSHPSACSSFKISCVFCVSSISDLGYGVCFSTAPSVLTQCGAILVVLTQCGAILVTMCTSHLCVPTISFCSEARPLKRLRRHVLRLNVYRSWQPPCLHQWCSWWN